MDDFQVEKVSQFIPSRRNIVKKGSGVRQQWDLVVEKQITLLTPLISHVWLDFSLPGTLCFILSSSAPMLNDLL